MSINAKNNITSKNFLYLEKLCLTIARKESPVDSGNMRDNAIYIRQTSNGFQVVWDNQFAYYLPIVDKNQHVSYSDIGLKGPSAKTRNKGTKEQNLGFVHRTTRQLNEVCKNYINNPADIYKEYANKKIDLNPKMINEEKTLNEKVENLVKNNDMKKAKRLIKNFYRDPKHRRYMISQKLFEMSKKIDEE